jgi:hypothetical protein
MIGMMLSNPKSLDLIYYRLKSAKVYLKSIPYSGNRA